MKIFFQGRICRFPRGVGRGCNKISRGPLKLGPILGWPRIPWGLLTSPSQILGDPQVPLDVDKESMRDRVEIDTPYIRT